MKLLIYAHYYIPDVAATGQLLADLAEGLSDTMDVTVICTVPSYSGRIMPGYREKKIYEEDIRGVRVLRVPVTPFTKKRLLSRVRNILSYALGAIKATKKAGVQDCVLAISQPPVLGGLLGVYGAWRKKARFLYCIQDFNPEQIMAVGYVRNRPVLNLMMALDRFSCKKSDLVITVGRDLVETLKHRFQGRRMPDYCMINNWADENAITPLERTESRVQAFLQEHDLTDRFVIMYSGNLGLYYGLKHLLSLLRQFDDSFTAADGRKVTFVFSGDGTLRKDLEAYAERHNMSHIRFVPYQTKEDLPYALAAADVHLCMSARHIKGVSVPSKCYGIMATGRPVLGILEEGTEARCIIEEADCGIVCTPGDTNAITEAIREMAAMAVDDTLHEMGMKGRCYLEVNFTKTRAINRYREVILQAKLSCGKTV